MRLKPALLFLSVFRIFSCLGQHPVLLKNWADCGIKVNSAGGLGNTSNKALEYPAGSSKYALNRLDFWVTGIDQSGDTVAFCSDIFTDKSAWLEGPAAIGGNYGHVSSAIWNNFTEVSAAEVATHRTDFQKNGYVAPDGIQRWPAAFNAAGFPTVLAPYADYDQNKKYEFSKGDYPYVPGSNNLFAMGSDSTELLTGKGPSSHLDMSVLWFVPQNQDSAPNTIFYRTTVCNRGNEDVTGLRIAAVADMQIGDATDNFLETDVLFNSLNGYNTIGNDAVYNGNWPAISIGWLSEKAQNSIYFESGNDAVKGKPITASDYYFLSNSYWKTGKFLSFGASGLDGSTPAKYIYSNGSDPGQANKDWDETPGTAGKRTGLIAYGLDVLKANSCKAADGFISIVPNAPDSADRRNNLAVLSRYYARSEFSVSNGNAIHKRAVLRAYPNPVITGSNLYLTEVDGHFEMDVYDVNGSFIKRLVANGNSIPVELQAGIYFLRSPGGWQTKLVILGN